MSARRTRIYEADDTLDLIDAAAYLRVTTRTVKRYRAQHGIGYVGNNGLLYFTRAELDSLLVWLAQPRESVH
jgi:hypothetical protein